MLSTQTALELVENGAPMEAVVQLLEVNLSVLSPKDQKLAAELERLIKKEKETTNNRVAIHNWNTELLGLYNKCKPKGTLDQKPFEHPKIKTSVLNRF